MRSIKDGYIDTIRYDTIDRLTEQKMSIIVWLGVWSVENCGEGRVHRQRMKWQIDS